MPGHLEPVAWKHTALLPSAASGLSNLGECGVSACLATIKKDVACLPAVVDAHLAGRRIVCSMTENWAFQ